MIEDKEFLIVAGEASGDLHASKLITQIRDLCGGKVKFFGCAGPQMRSAGVETIVRADDLSVVGLPEIARALPMFVRAFRDLKRAATERRADAAILVDFPDFNLRLAKALKKQHLKVIYYISPQLWAWRQHRIRTIEKYVDLLITILPFEKAWYARHGVGHVEYVGSPLAREVAPTVSREKFCAEFGLDASRPIVALLPGSRQKEVSRIYPEMLKAAEIIAWQNKDVQVIVALTEDTRLHPRPSVIKYQIVRGRTYDVLNAATAAAITSGTATLEAAVIGTPMAIVYKTSALNYSLLRPLIDVDHFGLVNLIAGRRVVNELIQNDFTPDSLAREILRLLEPSASSAVRTELAAVSEMLGSGGASRRAAEAVLRVTNADRPADAQRL